MWFAISHTKFASTGNVFMWYMDLNYTFLHTPTHNNSEHRTYTITRTHTHTPIQNGIVGTWLRHVSHRKLIGPALFGKVRVAFLKDVA